MKGGNGPTKQLQDVYWSAFDYASHVPQSSLATITDNCHPLPSVILCWTIEMDITILCYKFSCELISCITLICLIEQPLTDFFGRFKNSANLSFSALYPAINLYSWVCCAGVALLLGASNA